MLSELYHLSKNLAKGQSESRLVHADFGEPGLSTNTNIRLIIGPNGTILRMDILGAMETKGENCLAFWTLKKANFKFFPAMRIKVPLIQLSAHDPAWESLKIFSIDGLLQLLSPPASISPPSLKGEREQAQRMQKWRHDDPDVISCLREFSASFLSLSENAEAFASKLLEVATHTLHRKRDEKFAKALQILAWGSPKKRKDGTLKQACDIQMILDYQPEGQAAGCLYTPRIQRVVLECLNAVEPIAKKTKKNAAQELIFPCAFEGENPETLPLLNSPYPKWSAKPVIGNPFYAYAKNSAAPCNHRYGQADTAGFPIGSNTAKAIVGFAASLTTPERRGTTWQAIKNGKFEQKKEASDVLIAFPSFSWEQLAPVSIFTQAQAEEPESDDPDDIRDSVASVASRSFTQIAEKYIRTLKEKVPESERNRSFIRLLLLRSISPGQVQLAYFASPTCKEFDAAVSYWIASENYLPPRLLIPLPSKTTESGIGWFRPRLLFPDEAIMALTHQWIRGGNESTRIQAPPVGDIFNVFLRHDGLWEQSARELLATLLPRVEPLLIAAGQRLHLTDRSNLKEWNDFVPKTAQGLPDKRKPDPRYSLSKSLGLIGTLLHALNATNINYMKETAYQLGRLLAAMDNLHRCYCDGERGGSYPPTLMGNGLLGRAADSPKEALAELCERGRIYLGWAGTAQPVNAENPDPKKQKDEERKRMAVFSARKLLRLIAPISEELHQSTDLEKPMDSQGKAHLFLGYLTRILGEKEEGDQVKNKAVDNSPDNQ